MLSNWLHYALGTLISQIVCDFLLEYPQVILMRIRSTINIYLWQKIILSLYFDCLEFSAAFAYLTNTTVVSCIQRSGHNLCIQYCVHYIDIKMCCPYESHDKWKPKQPIKFTRQNNIVYFYDVHTINAGKLMIQCAQIYPIQMTINQCLILRFSFSATVHRKHENRQIFRPAIE